MKTKDFYYDLPMELIAQHPAERRDHSRLLVLNKKTGEMEHKHFYDIIDYLNEGDVLVLNDTKVMPARIYGHRKDKEEKIEFLLLNRKNDVWECLSKPGKKAKIGTEIIFSDKLSAEVVDISDDGSRFLKFEYDGIFEEILDELGEMPLPPYITEKLEDKNRYQTVYAREEGSAAAPTAGLHFTKELLDKVKNKGVEICYITLHVGLGTFRPVKVENIDEHEMHSEFYIMTEEVADKINSAKERGNRVIAVGTTSVRTVESIADESGKVREKKWFYKYFHLPAI